MTDFPYELDRESRIAEADAVVADARRSVRSWIVARNGGAAPGSAAATFGRFRRHFQTLEDVLERMLDAVISDLHALPAGCSAALVYERCRATERRVGKVRAAFRWYADKYEQREGAAAAGYGRVLLAADEVVRSCWDTPFTSSGRPRPTAPLCYLDESFDAAATPRKSPPRGIPAGDAVVGRFVQKLPVPTIALPVTCLEQPWWLAVVAHEVGHHVQFDLDPGLESATAEAVANVIPPALAPEWQRWSVEAFADAWSVLMVGGAAPWLLAQLLAAPPETLLSPSAADSRYPPPLLRLAMLGEIGALLGADQPGPGVEDIRALLARSEYQHADADGLAEHEAHLAVAAAVAGALLDVDAAGAPVRERSGFEADHLTAKGIVDKWKNALYAAKPAVAPANKPWSARIMTAALAAAARGVPVTSPNRAQLLEAFRKHALEMLPSFGPEGDLAVEDNDAALADASAARLASELVVDLYAEAP